MKQKKYMPLETGGLQQRELQSEGAASLLEVLDIPPDQSVVLLQLLYTLFHELHSTNRLGLFIGLLTSSTDSALLWMLNSRSIDIIASWLRLSENNTFLIKEPVRLSSVVTISAIDMYAAKGMAEKIQSLINRRRIFPGHLNRTFRLFVVSFIINGFAVIGPAGLIYKLFASNAFKATYFACAISLVNFLSGSFFMTSLLEDVGRLITRKDPVRQMKEEKIRKFIGQIISFFADKDHAEYQRLSRATAEALRDNSLTRLLDLLNLNEVTNTTHDEDHEVAPAANRRSLAISLVPLIFGSFMGVNTAWLHYEVALGNIPQIIPDSQKGSLDYFRHWCAICFAAMYGAVGIYSGLNFFSNLFVFNFSDVRCSKMTIGFLVFVIGAIAALTTVGLTYDNMERHGERQYMYFAAFFSMLIVNINAIRHISLRDLCVDLFHDAKSFLNSARNRNCSFFGCRTSFFSSGEMLLFSPKKELKRKAKDLLSQVGDATDQDLDRLEAAICLIPSVANR